MPQDLLQIALEHHRAGRVRQAEAGYRAALEANPYNAEALHWLGVLMVQAGQADQAVGLLEQAARFRPKDPAYQHNLAQAYLLAGRADDAIRAFERSAVLDATRIETLLGLGLAYLARHRPGDAQAAVDTLRQARRVGLDSFDLHHHLGMALLATGDAEGAISSQWRAIDRRADDAAAYYHLALAYRAKGDNPAARANLTKTLELRPAHVRACHALGVLTSEAGDLRGAADLFRRAVAIDPNFAPAYHALGEVLQRSGNAYDAVSAFRLAAEAARESDEPPDAIPASEAVADLERKLALSGDAAALHFALASYAGMSVAPAQVPAESIATLFDRYADKFDEHLRDKLQYRVPELIAAAIRAADPPTPADVLDLGCGTGLCAPLLRPMARLLSGVDLSPAMVEKARARGLYDQLAIGDLVAALGSAPRGFDLLVAADVLVYVGDLAPTFEAAARCLRPGGLLVFSVEAGDGDRFQLQPNHRFKHSKAYLRRLAAMYGFAEESFAEIVGRTEADRPVAGFLVALRLPPASAAAP